MLAATSRCALLPVPRCCPEASHLILSPPGVLYISGPSRRNVLDRTEESVRVSIAGGAYARGFEREPENGRDDIDGASDDPGGRLALDDSGSGQPGHDAGRRRGCARDRGTEVTYPIAV